MFVLNPWKAARRARGKNHSGQDEPGATLVEYALLLALIAVVAIGALIYLGQATTNTLVSVGQNIATSGRGASGSGSTTTTSVGPTTTTTQGLDLTNTGTTQNPITAAQGGNVDLSTNVTPGYTIAIVYSIGTVTPAGSDITLDNYNNSQLDVGDNATAGTYTVPVTATEYTGTHCNDLQGVYYCTQKVTSTTQNVYIEVPLVITNAGTATTPDCVGQGDSLTLTVNAHNGDQVTFSGGTIGTHSLPYDGIDWGSGGTLETSSATLYPDLYTITGIEAKDTTASLSTAATTVYLQVDHHSYDC